MNGILNILISALLLLRFTAIANAQVNVILDNYYNHEINSKTGKGYHYLWSDSTYSGYSQWGEILQKKKCVLYELTSKPTPSNLKDADIYIIVDPDDSNENPKPHYILHQETKTIDNWVKQGGILILLANDSANCEFKHLNKLAGNFGIHFNQVNLLDVTGRNWEMGAIKNLPRSPIFLNVRKIFLKEVSTLSLSVPAKPVLTWNNNTIMAQSSLGKGMVFAIGDPWIYNEYIDHAFLPVSFDNYKAAQNLSDYFIRLCRKEKQ